MFPLFILLASFVNGASAMAMELVGSRLLAPSLGTSIFVWTSLIGVILAALALGAHLGGIVADRNAGGPPSRELRALGLIWRMASVFGCLAIVYSLPVLAWLSSFPSVRTASLIAALLIFAPAMTMLGMSGPILSRLRIGSLEKSGRAIGTVSALGTLGGIAGTFAGGFWLISVLGTMTILLICAIIPFLLGVACWIIAKHLEKKEKSQTDGAMRKKRSPVFLAGICLLHLFLFMLAWQVAVMSLNPNSVTIDTQYSRITVSRGYDAEKNIVRSYTNSIHGTQSAIYEDPAKRLQPVFQYLKLFDLHLLASSASTTLQASPSAPEQPMRALAIGAGAFTYPRRFLALHPESTIDVAEIDPALIPLSMRYFFLKAPGVPADQGGEPRLKVFSEDGRHYLDRMQQALQALHRTDGPYQFIFLDAFNADVSVPFQLVSAEAFSQMKSDLTPDGTIVMNLISPATFSPDTILPHVLASIRLSFPSIHLFQAYTNEPAAQVQNLIIVASKNPDFRLRAGALPEESLSPAEQEVIKKGTALDKNAEASKAIAYLGNEVPLPEEFANGTSSAGALRSLVLTDDFAPVEVLSERAYGE